MLRGTSTGWGTQLPLSEWYGVTTDDAGRVASLNLEANGLCGTIPQDVTSMSALRVLRLADNDLRVPDAARGKLKCEGLRELQTLFGVLAGSAGIGGWFRGGRKSVVR